MESTEKKNNNGTTGKEKKKDMIVRRVKEEIEKYRITLTVRQAYYRLVSSQDIENNRYEYTYFDKCLTEARQKDLIDPGYFEDRTRKVIERITCIAPSSFKGELANKLEEVREPPLAWFGANLLQQKICLIMLEKQALERVFSEAISNMCILIVCKGFNSFSQLYQLKELLKNDQREVNCYTFSDYDPSGLLIQQNFRRQCEEILGIEFHSFERIALTEELIEKYDLPYNPTKKNTTHAKVQNLDFNLEGKGSVELDALDPNILVSLIKECIKENYDQDLRNQIVRVQRIRNRRLKKAYSRELNTLAREILETEKEGGID